MLACQRENEAKFVRFSVFLNFDILCFFVHKKIKNVHIWEIDFRENTGVRIAGIVKKYEGKSAVLLDYEPPECYTNTRKKLTPVRAGTTFSEAA